MIVSPAIATAPSLITERSGSIVTIVPRITIGVAGGAVDISLGCQTMNDILCANDAFVNAWYVVARSVEVGPTPVPVTLLARELVVYRASDGTVVAAPDR